MVTAQFLVYGVGFGIVSVQVSVYAMAQFVGQVTVYVGYGVVYGVGYDQVVALFAVQLFVAEWLWYSLCYDRCYGIGYNVGYSVGYSADYGAVYGVGYGIVYSAQ